MIRGLLAAAAAAAALGCHRGARLATFAPARAPAGIQTVVDTTPSTVATSRVAGLPLATPKVPPLRGELLAVDGGSLYILTDPTATSIHLFRVDAGRIRTLTLHQRGRVKGIGESVQQLARFPQGMDEELLARLLHVYGIAALERVR